MERSEQFELGIEITKLLEDIDQRQVLETGEWDELFDHFLCSTDELEKMGLSTEEAFAVSKMRFGETALVRKEYEKVNPFGSIRQNVIFGLSFVFGAWSILSVLNVISCTTILLFNNFDIPNFYAQLVDLVLKISISLGISFAIIRSIKRFPKILVATLPVFSISLYVLQAWLWTNMFRLGWVTQTDLFSIIQQHTAWIYITGLALLILTSYFLILFNKKRSRSPSFL